MGAESSLNIEMTGRSERFESALAKANAQAVQKLQANYGVGAGAAGAGSSSQILNKLLVAAGPSPVPVTEFAKAASISATNWRGFGGGDESQLATLSVLSKSFKSADIASERMSGLSAAVREKRGLIDWKKVPGGDQGLGGLELVDQLADLEARKALTTKEGKPVSLQERLGSREAFEGYSAIMNLRKEIADLQKRIEQAERETGTKNDVLNTRLSIVESDKGITSIEDANKLKQTNLQEEIERAGRFTKLTDSSGCPGVRRAGGAQPANADGRQETARYPAAGRSPRWPSDGSPTPNRMATSRTSYKRLDDSGGGETGSRGNTTGECGPRARVRSEQAGKRNQGSEVGRAAGNEQVGVGIR